MGLEKFFSLTNEGSSVFIYAADPEEPRLPGFPEVPHTEPQPEPQDLREPPDPNQREFDF